MFFRPQRLSRMISGAILLTKIKTQSEDNSRKARCENLENVHFSPLSCLLAGPLCQDRMPRPSLQHLFTFHPPCLHHHHHQDCQASETDSVLVHNARDWILRPRAPYFPSPSPAFYQDHMFDWPQHLSQSIIEPKFYITACCPAFFL